MRWMFCISLLVVAGCGGNHGPELPVSGSVTLDDKPVADALVRFFPDKDTDPTSSGHGRTGTDGKFIVTSGTGKKGLAPGRYKVTVNKAVNVQAGDSEQGAGAIVEGLDIKDDFPPYYSNPAQTVLAYTITGDGKPIEIKLESKKKK
ncbi:MAG: carboxypeptidase-like regulatory domain-containing protein [Gemmataceae bacterium]|nr:carboxypeptidase-like regulatory domain-containing protein [Gemmata sp.]MDW8199475.1 carboxypeptidase-like regulatory domain-containing protein [Gemmataceae bacterium]